MGGKVVEDVGIIPSMKKTRPFQENVKHILIKMQQKPKNSVTCGIFQNSRRPNKEFLKRQGGVGLGIKGYLTNPATNTLCRTSS